MKFSDKDLDILYLDNHLLVLNKPEGLLTQNVNNSKSLEHFAKSFLQKRYNKSKVFLHPIHRLDKDVSGIVIFAKTSKALSRLNEQMRKRQITKKYTALVEGILKEKKGCLEHHLLHIDHKAIVSDSPQSKKAVLYYEVIREKNNKSLLDITLETGRYHQIRVQLQAINHSIIGDKKYGKTPFSRICLHGYFVEFFHPISQEKISFFSKVNFGII